MPSAMKSQELTFLLAERSTLQRLLEDTPRSAVLDRWGLDRNQDAIKKTAAGMLKLLYPHRTVENLGEGEIAPIIEFGVEMRKRTTDQLALVLPAEFSNIEYGYRLHRSG